MKFLKCFLYGALFSAYFILTLPPRIIFALVFGIAYFGGFDETTLDYLVDRDLEFLKRFKP